MADYSNYHQDWYLQQAITGLYDQPLPADTVSFDQVNQDLDPTSRVKGHGYQFNADYYFENDAKLTTILAARDWQSRLVTDIDYSPADLLSVDYQDDIRQYSQEIRYTSAKDISWPFVVGLYFLQDETQNDRLALYGQDVNTRVVLPNVPFPVPFGFAFNIQPNTPLPLDARVKSDIKAIYTNIDHRFDDYVLHLGGRYSVESKKLRYSVDGRGSGLLDLAVVDQERDRIDQTFFSPMIGLSYFVNDRTQVYAKASRAYKSGGWNAEFVDSAQFEDGIEYRYESVNAYEIGYKSHDDRQQIAVSAFVNLYKDYQLFQFANLGGNTLAVQLRNAAKVKSQGIELNYKRLIGDRWILDSKLAYLDARFQSYPSARNDGSDADGERLPDAPEFSGSVSLSYQAQLSKLKNPLLMTLQNNFQTSTYSGFGDDPDTAKLGSRFIFNVYANYTTADRKWSFQLWAKNLTDKRYALTRGRSLFRNQIATFGLPRMYGINGTYHF